MSDCHISGCKKLKTTCEDCGRVVNKISDIQPKWISVKDELPPWVGGFSPPVLAVDSDGDIFIAFRKICPSSLETVWEEHVFYASTDGYGNGYTKDVTHWMELPEPITSLLEDILHELKCINENMRTT